MRVSGLSWCFRCQTQEKFRFNKTKNYLFCLELKITCKTMNSRYNFFRFWILAITIFSFSTTKILGQGDSLVTNPKFTIDNCVTEFSMDKTKKTDVGYQFWFADPNFIDGRTLKMSVVAPRSATHPPHKHAEDEFFFILEGTAEFYLDGKTKVAGAYTSFYCPSNAMHGIKNAGDTELKYLVIKKYPSKTK